MTPEQLKASILQYAIQGKLVEQRPEEGTGEELYQQIVKNRELLIERKVIKRDKRTETAIDPNAIPFDVPENWKWVTLGSILNKLTDGTHKTPKYTTDGIKFVSVKDMSNGVLSLENTKFISAEEHQELFARCNPEKGDILLSKVGTTGVPAIVNTTEQFSLFVSVALLKFDCECIDLKFLYYMLMSPLVQIQATENTRGVGNKNWVLDAIANTMVVLPPLAEQKRIVLKVEELLPYVDRYAAAYEKLEQFSAKFPEDMKKSILQYAIQGKLVEQRPEEGTGEELYQQIQTEKQRLIKEGKIKKEKPLAEIAEDEIPFDIPESWKWVRIGCIFTTSSGTTPSKSNLEYYSEPDYNWVRTTDLNNGILNACELKISQKAVDECRLSIIPQESVCVAMYGGAGTIGKNAIIRFDTTINQSVCAIQPNGFCDMVFLQRFLQLHRPNWMKMAVGSRKDPNINQIIIKYALFPLPPLAEQKRIVAKLEEILPLCERLK